MGRLRDAGAGDAGGGVRPALNLVTHSTVTIDRPAALVWPHIAEVNAWKQGATLRHHDGPVGETGETLAAIDPANPEAIGFYAENVEVVPGRRRSMKLYLPSGVLIGFASWTLAEEGGRTAVSYDVYSEFLLEPAQLAAMTPAQRAEQQQSHTTMNQQRFDAELVALARLATV